MRKIIISILLSVVLIFSFIIQERIVGALGLGDYSKRVILTFDDGPNPEYTQLILDELAKHQIKVIFFVVGSEIELYPDLVKEIDRQGHFLGNHTYSHRSISNLSQEELEDELLACNNIVEQLTGQRMSFFRPPRGLYTKQNIKNIQDLGFKNLMWDVGLEKQTIKDPRMLVDHLMSRIKGKKNLIVLLHDGDVEGRHSRELTVKALPLLIESLKKEGYKIVDPKSKEGQEIIQKAVWME